MVFQMLSLWDPQTGRQRLPAGGAAEFRPTREARAALERLARE
jgi:hypothetical protein